MKSKISLKSTHNRNHNPANNRNCYVCGSKYHLQAECPQENVNNARYDRNSRSESSQRRHNINGNKLMNSFKNIRSSCAQFGIHQNDPEASMYVRALVYNVKTKNSER